eukprot:scaffold73611_cov23-Cyclotella_meneghiniana.AAC.1
MASWQQFLCPKDTHTKKSENCACALSSSPIQMLPARRTSHNAQRTTHNAQQEPKIHFPSP